MIDTPAPLTPLCGQDRGHPTDLILVEQWACTRCDHSFVVTQRRDERVPQFHDIIHDGAAVTHCPQCNQALSLATVYDAAKHDRIGAQLIKRRSEVGDEDAVIDELEEGLAALHSYTFMWDLWSYMQQTQQSAA